LIQVRILGPQLEGDMETWHKRINRYHKAQLERVKVPKKRSRRYLWMAILAVALYVLFRFVLHI
jgi:hypothetical protein